MLDVVRQGVAPGTWFAWSIIAASIGCLICVGRFSPRMVTAGTVLLVVGASLTVADNWIVVKDIWQPRHWSVGSLYTTFEAGVWFLCAVDALIALLVLTGLRSAGHRPRILAEMARFDLIGRRRQTSHRTYRVSRLAWLVVGVAATLLMATAIQFANGVLLRHHVLGIPLDLYRDPAANRAYVEAHPAVAIGAALLDLAQIVLTIVLAVVIMRFFWRLVVADARRLLEDHNYRPIVFLRSFADDAATVTSKRLFDRLVWRRRRLEEIAVSALAPLGAAIAIGQPGERLPKLGAVRAYYPDDEWQAAVLEWMRRARLIVLVAGASHWTLWELRRALELGYHDKLMLVLPPDPTIDARRARWQALAATVSKTVWETAFGGLSPTGCLAAVPRPDGSLLPITGNAGMQSDYEVALRLAVVDMLAPALQSAAPPEQARLRH